MDTLQALHLLELTSPYTTEDIKLAYRKKAKKYHPDLCGEETTFRLLTEAKELLEKALEEPHTKAIENIYTFEERPVVNYINTLVFHSEMVLYNNDLDTFNSLFRDTSLKKPHYNINSLLYYG